jgi:hypothetical protein
VSASLSDAFALGFRAGQRTLAAAQGLTTLALGEAGAAFGGNASIIDCGNALDR